MLCLSTCDSLTDFTVMSSTQTLRVWEAEGELQRGFLACTSGLVYFLRGVKQQVKYSSTKPALLFGTLSTTLPPSVMVLTLSMRVS